MYINPHDPFRFPYPARAPQDGSPFPLYPWRPQDGQYPSWVPMTGWPLGGRGPNAVYPGLEGPQFPPLSPQGQEARKPFSPQEEGSFFVSTGAQNPLPPQDERSPVVEGLDQGEKPFVIGIEEAAERNTNFRRALWTGKHLQVVLMSIGVGGDIGLEVHPDVDQFIRIEQGNALVQMGERRDRLNFVRRVSEGDAIMIPAGTWHNVTNLGFSPLKLYTIYAPPEHPKGTVQRTKAEAMAEQR